jgi:hypothetical protein
VSFEPRRQNCASPSWRSAWAACAARSRSRCARQCRGAAHARPARPPRARPAAAGTRRNAGRSRSLAPVFNPWLSARSTPRLLGSLRLRRFWRIDACTLRSRVSTRISGSSRVVSRRIDTAPAVRTVAPAVRTVAPAVRTEMRALRTRCSDTGDEDHCSAEQ